MFYSEKIINGVMHWKSSPDSKWIPYTVKTLTARYASMLRKYHELERVLEEIHTLSDGDL